jgi:hypothetical protein
VPGRYGQQGLKASDVLAANLRASAAPEGRRCTGSMSASMTSTLKSMAFVSCVVVYQTASKVNAKLFVAAISWRRGKRGQ